MNKDLVKEYYPYVDWEDYKHGMYKTGILKDINVRKSGELLSNSRLFREASEGMLKKWKVSARENLTDAGRNRRAWIGQATCCFKHGATEQETKLAWKRLSEKQQDNANNVADRVILEWVINNRDDGGQYEFKF